MKITLTTLSHDVLAGPGELVCMVLPQLGGFSACIPPVDASNHLVKARMLPHLPLHPGLADVYCSQERREYIMGFEGLQW